MITKQHKQLFLSLTPSQLEDFSLICRSLRPRSFPVAESLRKLGLVTRNTEYVIKRVFADQKDEHIQWDKVKNPIKLHEWSTTILGERIEELMQKFEAIT